MTPEDFAVFDNRIKDALEVQQRYINGALARLANRLEQRARRQAQFMAEWHFGKGQVPEEVTNTIAKIWLDWQDSPTSSLTERFYRTADHLRPSQSEDNAQ